MSKRNKLQKFSELISFPNVYENFDFLKPELIGQEGKKKKLKGSWSTDHFGNDHPITLELACGRGEYTLQLASNFPDRNFIGVDIKGARIWKGAKTALEQKLANAAFLRTRIELIDNFFAPGEVSEIWITFPDPFLKKGKDNRRLTALPFLKKYKTLLSSNGICHLKTDSTELFDFTLEVFENSNIVTLEDVNEDIYSGVLPIPELSYKTYYEEMHLAIGKKIKYIRFSFS